MCINVECKLKGGRVGTKLDPRKHEKFVEIEMIFFKRKKCRYFIEELEN